MLILGSNRLNRRAGSASAEHERSGAYEGKYQFVYVTPEYLATRSMQELQELHRNCKFCCLAVDEAHCISSWGKGYRSSFLALSRLRSPESPLRDVPWIAVTATASRAVQVDAVHYICAALQWACTPLEAALLPEPGCGNPYPVLMAIACIRHRY